ncbi:hypothetical protein DEU56DRAFT_834233 [Suillus clintonianus]|uniref:uncharacterized protein n=1 Tax=Suillus clintonianus TaxID=1904413 RepID=UPI001B85E045|nr:uncharacterized protein DEU56DRAFT_834233 [Suillus clintonianus]KAG2121438.1 hypothetical protein DEU56DRAFT_834233 [Suillus clintonianus]
MMSIGSSSAGSTPYVRPRSSSGSFNQSSSPSFSGYRPPSLAASPIIEAPPHPSHKRSSSYNFPAPGDGSYPHSRSSSVVHSPSTPDHRNSHSFSHSPSPRSQSSIFFSPAMSMHNQSPPVPSTPPRYVPFQESSSFADRDCDEVDLAAHIKGDVTPPGRPPRRWWNLTVPWNADEWWTPGEFVYQDEPRVDERLNPVRPTKLHLPTSDGTSDGEPRELTIRPLCVGIAEAEREAMLKNSMFAPFRWQGKDSDKERDEKLKALSHFTDAERDGFNRARSTVILACHSVMTRDELTSEHVKMNPAASCVVSTLGTIIDEALPVLKTILESTYDLAGLVPVPFFLEASRTLLIIWEACEQLSSNRLSCLRIVERCAGMLYFMREQIEGVGPIVGKELDAAFHVFREVIFQIEGFLCRISRRPMLKRFIRRAEIAKELCNCDQALMDAWLRLNATMSVRIVKNVVCLDGKIEDLVTAVLSDNTSTLCANCDTETSAEPNDRLAETVPSIPECLTTTEGDVRRELNPIFPEENPDKDLRLDQFQLEHLPGFINTAQCDADVLNGLEIERNEVAEIMKAMRRQLESLRHEFSRSTAAASDSTLAEMELLDASIASMSKLRCMQVRGAGTDNSLSPWELPSWTITRYEVDRFEMIGQGSFSRVYAGSWRDRVVAIKVLHDFTPASTFRREVELWRRLRHPQVVHMFGASSAHGSKPWFIVSELYERGSLVEWLLTTARDDHAMPRHADQFRFISQIAGGMEYLHSQKVVHGDLKCANVFVNKEGNCAIADFGQSELKDDAYRLSGCQRPKGTPRWKAPELLDGAASPTMQADVYAYAICCVEILNMGGIPYGTRDDEDVKRIVLERDGRPEVSDTPLADIVLPIISCCWARNPRYRSPFPMTVFWLRGCRNFVYPYGADGLPTPCTPNGPANSPVVGYSDRPSPGLRFFGTPTSDRYSWLPHTPSMSDYFSTSSGFGSEFGYSEPDSDLQDIPESSMSTETSGFVDPNAVCEVGTTTDHTTDDLLPELSTNTWARAMQNERRYRILARDTHEYEKWFTTPLWYPSPVEVGAVGYVSKPDGEFITLCNVIELGGKKKAEGDVAKCMRSLRDYGTINIEKTRRVQNGFLNRLKFGANRREGDVSRRQEFPLQAGKKTAAVYAESFERRDFSDGSLTAARQWFKENIHTVLQEYAPNHPIQKEDVFLVTNTVNARDYALFVADPISSGVAYFNVFSSHKANHPWGTFTVKYDGQDYFPAEANFTSKVSRSRKTWDTILLARLRFVPDAEEPTLY